MKHIIIGLGNFGGSLALKLTGQGHDVIGVDRNMQKVDFYKDRITHLSRFYRHSRRRCWASPARS